MNAINANPASPSTKASTAGTETAHAGAPLLRAAEIPPPSSSQWKIRLKSAALALLPPVLGLMLFIGIWALVSQTSPQLPGPLKTWDAAVKLFSDPFYRNGPNDQGIGWNILFSLERVGIGVGMAALIGIPLGFM